MNDWRGPVRVLDLSRTGAFVETDADAQFGDTGELALELPGGRSWRAPVTVIRLGMTQREIAHPAVENVTVLSAGAGLRFDEVTQEAADALEALLAGFDER